MTKNISISELIIATILISAFIVPFAFDTYCSFSLNNETGIIGCAYAK